MLRRLRDDSATVVSPGEGGQHERVQAASGDADQSGAGGAGGAVPISGHAFHGLVLLVRC